MEDKKEPAITVLTPGTDEYNNSKKILNSAVHDQSKRFNYDNLAEEYNRATVGSILILNYSSQLKSSNVVRVVEGRGLQTKLDFTVNKATRNTRGQKLDESDRFQMITKLSETPMMLKADL